MRVSIIIPVKAINDYIREAMVFLIDLDYEDYEILIFPDHLSGDNFPKTRIIASGEVGPAVKRDMALEYATGEVFAFIDDDAYPRKDWLKNAVKYFEDDSIGAVGGPAVTPSDDNLMQQASGKVYESFLCSGPYTYRYKPGKIMDVDDLPSVNLIVRRDIFKAVGGFDLDYYPGEDTKLCLDITKKLNKRIVYDPDIFVWHHRRNLFKGHLKQITNYAEHRGYFAKRLPATSLRLAYFIPSLFVCGLIVGPFASMVFLPFIYVYFLALICYVFLLFTATKGVNGARLSLLTMAGIFTSHVGYGIFFIKGLLRRKMSR